MDERQGRDAPVGGKIRCDACPVMCYIAEGRAGACDRYANENGRLIRVDPLTIIAEQAASEAGQLVPFLGGEEPGEWDGSIVPGERAFVTAIGAGTTYP
ncbi:MAG: 6-hydroxynicotinate reductase, partial [Pseudomonadota bacterium]